MITNDPIADMLTRIRNAWMVRSARTTVPASKAKIAVLKILKDEGLIDDFRVEPARQASEAGGGDTRKNFTIYLQYENDEPPVEKMKRVSKPGQRIYRGHRELKLLRQGYGFRIVSTSRGVMTDAEARKRKLGGEVICEIIR